VGLGALRERREVGIICGGEWNGLKNNYMARQGLKVGDGNKDSPHMSK